MNSIFSASRFKATTTKAGSDKSATYEALEITLAGQRYPLRIKKLSQSRSISVSADTVKGEVCLNMPRYANTAQALRFAQSKSEWLAARFAEAPPPVPLIHGAEIAFMGEAYIIQWSHEYPRKPKASDGIIKVGGPKERIASRIISWMKDHARKVYAQDLEFYCQNAGAQMPQLSIGDARRRWGSCSGGSRSKGQSIRLNWRLIMAPPAVRRSVVAHEVAHLTHMNHSAALPPFG